MRSLQNRPGYGGGVHAAAQHGNHVGRKNKTQPAFLQNLSHDSNLTWGRRLKLERSFCREVLSWWTSSRSRPAVLSVPALLLPAWQVFPALLGRLAARAA